MKIKPTVPHIPEIPTTTNPLTFLSLNPAEIAAKLVIGITLDIVADKISKKIEESIENKG